ncbi:Coilin [Trichoplax sp. H2]|nr:Coilin [Trichoplax sp. H2]|eukprot:RDD45322.1 Coilin [Trichoplax sp. H2]
MASKTGRSSCVRIKLKFANVACKDFTSAWRRCWFIFDSNSCRLVADLIYLIQKRFALNRKSSYHLYLDDYLIQHDEAIEIIRDNDIIVVEQDDSTNKDLQMAYSHAGTRVKRNKTNNLTSKEGHLKSSEASEDTSNEKQSCSESNVDIKNTTNEEQSSSSSVDSSSSTSSTESDDSSSDSSTSDGDSVADQDERVDSNVPSYHLKGDKDESMDIDKSATQVSNNHVLTPSKDGKKSGLQGIEEISKNTSSNIAIQNHPLLSDSQLSLGSKRASFNRSNETSTKKKKFDLSQNSVASTKGQHIRFDSEDENIQVQPNTLNNSNPSELSTCSDIDKGRKSVKVMTKSIAKNNLSESNWYKNLKILNAPPRSGDKIVFRVLELSSSYTPEISKFKEGVVESYNNATDQIIIKLTDRQLEKERKEWTEPGKFELFEGEEENYVKEIDPIVQTPWSSITEARLIES